MGNVVMRVLAAAMFALLLTGCSVRDNKYNPSHFHLTGIVTPPDVQIPAETKAFGVVHGLHVVSASAPAEELCCSIDSPVDLAVQKRNRARSLVFSLYVPDTGEFTNERQYIFLVFQGRARAPLASKLVPKFHTYRFSVPPELRNRIGVVHMRLESANRTRRPNFVTLTSIYFE